MEFVTTNSLILEFSIRSIAGPERTGCVQHAYTSAAPFSTNALAARVIVPAVSIISSIKIAVFLRCYLRYSLLQLHLVLDDVYQ